MTFKIISIDGNIGSGKSTLIERLKQKLEGNTNYIFLSEPIDIWNSIKDEDGHTILEKFYIDQNKYSFSFQIMAYISRLSIIRNVVKKNPTAIIITERSLYTDKFIFAKMLYDSKQIEDINYKIYEKWFDEFIDEYPVHKTVYLKTTPEIAYSRILKRNRHGEETIKLDYIKLCHEYHENMFNNNDIFKNNSCIIDKHYITDDELNEYIKTIFI